MKRLFALTIALVVVATAGAQAFGDISELKPGVSETRCNWGRVEIAPGGEHELARFDGAGIITYWYMTDGRGGIQDRNLVLRMYWDGSDTPSVNVPAADFFGAVGGKTVDYESLYFVVKHNCFQSFFPMPFSKGARIVLYNDGNQPYIRDVAYNFDVLMDSSYTDNRSRFHAVWNRSNPTDGLHTIIDVKGRGHYVGNIMHVYSKSMRWWGEGDTNFTINGRSMKHTPGTEDEYGACFDFGGRFNHLTSGYIMGGLLVDEQTGEYSYYGNNRMFRWYATNPVRFTDSFSANIENQYVAPGTVYDFKAQDVAHDDFTTIAYYYLDGVQGVSLAPYAERIEETKAENY